MYNKSHKERRKPRKLKGNPKEECRPKFSFYKIHKKYAVKCCEKSTKIALLNKLEHLSKMKWKDILGTNKEQGHEKIYANSIIPGIPEETVNESFFLSIRISNSKRVVGYRDLDTFHIIWIEEKPGTVYQH